MNIHQIANWAKTHIKRLIGSLTSGASILFAIRFSYFYYFKKSSDFPWDVDLALIVIMFIWGILSFSISFPVSVFVLLILLAGTTGYWLKRFKAKRTEENPEFFKKWKNCYWKIKCARLDSGKLRITDMDGPYCSAHKIRMREFYNEMQESNMYACDIDKCRQNISEYIVDGARRSLQSFKESNPQKLLAEDCKTF